MAQFNLPAGVGVDDCGIVYVSDTFNHTIRRITTDRNTIAVVEKNDPVAGLATSAQFVSFGTPIMNSEGQTAFYATITGTTAAATTALMGKTKGIWADDSAGTRQLIVRVGDSAVDTAGAVFSAMGDPVYNGNEEIAFKGTLKTGTGGVVSTPTATANDVGIWSNTGGAMHLVARRGSQAPGCPSGATFSSFPSIALPDHCGVVMLATLNPGAGGVLGSNNIGIWAVNSAGALELIVRKGDILGSGGVVSALSFLPAVLGVSGQTRNFSQNTGDLLYKANFVGGSKGIYRVIFP